MKNLGIILLVTLIWIGCSSDDPSSEAFAQIDVVTGLDLYDENGNGIGTWENPNHNPGPLRIFPVPAGNNIILSSQIIITDLWIVPASCDKDNTSRDIRSLSMDIEYDENEISSNSISYVPITNFNNQLALNLEGSTPGFYKIFVKTPNGDFHWQNIYYDPGLVPLVDFSALDDTCN